MNRWAEDIRQNKKLQAMPILTFPGIQYAGCSLNELVHSSDKMAEVMKIVADRTPDSITSLAFMDLSVESEAFGSPVIFAENEVPTIGQPIVTSFEEAQELTVPEVGAGRTGLAVETIQKAKKLIDKPVFAGAIGSFSLAGRIVGVTDAMINCYEEPEMMHEVLRKATDFLIKYVKALKSAGADGVVIAEPLAGLLSLDLIEEFSSPYMKEVVDAVQDENFMVIYHNCGNAVPKLISSILTIGAKGLHFGNAIQLRPMFDVVPSDILLMGNIDPAGEFACGTPASIYQKTQELAVNCGQFSNFVISSGCDIPAHAKWENIDSFFQAVIDYNNN